MLWECSDWHAVNRPGKKLKTSKYTAITRPLNATFWKDTIKYSPSCFLTPPSSPFKIKLFLSPLCSMAWKWLVYVQFSSLGVCIILILFMCTWNMISTAFVIVLLKVTQHQCCQCSAQTKSLILCYFLSFLSYSRNKYCRILTKQWLQSGW